MSQQHIAYLLIPFLLYFYIDNLNIYVKLNNDVIEDIYKDDENFKKIDIKEKLREEDIIMIYNKKFLTNAPIRFIEEFINIKIK